MTSDSRVKDSSARADGESGPGPGSHEKVEGPRFPGPVAPGRRPAYPLHSNDDSRPCLPLDAAVEPRAGRGQALCRAGRPRRARSGRQTVLRGQGATRRCGSGPSRAGWRRLRRLLRCRVLRCSRQAGIGLRCSRDGAGTPPRDPKHNAFRPSQDGPSDPLRQAHAGTHGGDPFRRHSRVNGGPAGPPEFGWRASLALPPATQPCRVRRPVPCDLPAGRDRLEGKDEDASR